MANNNISSEQPKVALRSVESLFRETWAFYKERWQVLVEIALLPTLVTALGYVLANIGFPFSIIGGIVIFVGWIIFMFSVLPIIFSIHHGAGVDASYKATLGWFWPFVWLTILEVLAIVGASFMLIIPGIWMAFTLSFMAYVFVIERRHGLDALRQSKDYIKGYWWAVVGRSLLLCLLYVIAAMIIEVPFVVIGGNTTGNIVSMALALFFIPFAMIYHYFIFKNLRDLKPELAAVQSGKGRGFIKASAIVGLVAPMLLIIAVVFLVGAGAFYGLRNADRYAIPPQGYHMSDPAQQ